MTALYEVVPVDSDGSGLPPVQRLRPGWTIERGLGGWLTVQLCDTPASAAHRARMPMAAAPSLSASSSAPRDNRVGRFGDDDNS